jgi:uroporphyrinogen-III synthase
MGVLVTRPAHQADHFINLLQQAGARAYALPAIAIQALTISDELKQHLLQSSRYQIVIFISANAVQWGIPHLKKCSGPQIAAIGEGSARALATQGWHVDLVADSGFTSEDFLALPALQAGSLTGKHILIVRGEGGREFLGETLQSRGAVVEYAQVYRRCQPQVDTQWLAPLWQQDIQVVCVTSNESLENLYHMLKPYRDQLLHTTLLVPGARAYQLAQSLGFTNIIQAASASDNNMLQRIIQWHSQPQQALT